VKLLQRAKDALRSVIKYMRSYTGMRHVAEIAGELLYAEDGFEQRLDNFPHLLPVRNGVVDLRTGALRARTKEDMLYKVVNVEYDALADCTLIRQTVLEAMADDAEVADFLQLLLGYGITGDVSEEVFVVFTGSGRNCKGVITQQLMDVLGPYFEDMNPGIIVVDRKCNIDAERGKLLGKRLALFNELDAGEVLKTNEVKLLSGGDGIVARPVYRDPMTIIPRHLCVLCTNHMPRVSPVIPAMIERLLVIPFPVSFTNLEQGEAPTLLRRQVDPSLKGRLKQARPGTLRWLVDGAVRWYAVRASSASASLRRSAPAKVRAYSAEYLDGEDRLGVFIRTYCELGADHFVYTSDLLAHINEGVDIKERWGPHALSHAMDLKGFTKKVKAYDGRPRGNGYAGLRLMLDL
jgi:putative DNA primase/helicase